jgi:hypothetical protein
VCQDLLVAFVGFNLAHGAHLKLSRHFVQVLLFVAFQCVFEFCTQTALSTLAVTISEGELGLLALEYER